MRIAEMEDHHGQLVALEAKIAEMERNVKFPEIFQICEDSFPHIVPAIKFRKRREITPETPPLRLFGVLWKYGPPLFEHAALESALDFVRSTRLLAKHEDGYLQAAEAAMEREEAARILWNHLDRQPGFLQRNIGQQLNLDRDVTVGILDVWEKLGVVARMPDKNTYKLYLGTRLDEETEGICLACGLRVKGRKYHLLKPVSCQRCKAKDFYHIVAVDHVFVEIVE